MDLLNLLKDAIISIESRGGQKRVFIYLRNQWVPLANWADLEEAITSGRPNWDCDTSIPLYRRGRRIQNN
jgi:hypothetical protein